MARSKIDPSTYTGEAKKAYEKIQKLEADLKTARVDLKKAYKEQLKQEKEIARKKAQEDEQNILTAIRSSSKTSEEILQFLES